MKFKLFQLKWKIKDWYSQQLWIEYLLIRLDLKQPRMRSHSLKITISDALLMTSRYPSEAVVEAIKRAIEQSWDEMARHMKYHYYPNPSSISFYFEYTLYRESIIGLTWYSTYWRHGFSFRHISELVETIEEKWHKFYAKMVQDNHWI
jgi:hypothetical protein